MVIAGREETVSEVALRLRKFVATQIGGGWELSVQEKEIGESV